ncbi:hypothetical protein TNCV_1677321 [Trichonephila clavipes]|nr:hypothetical protein TNCV_1677321 [Trichonephila clavipes]
MALYRSPLTVTLWPSSFLKKYGPMIPPVHKAHQTENVKRKLSLPLWPECKLLSSWFSTGRDGRCPPSGLQEIIPLKILEKKDNTTWGVESCRPTAILLGFCTSRTHYYTSTCSKNQF